MRLFYIFCLFLLANGISAQKVQDPAAARAAYDEGATLLRNKEFKKAARAFKQAVRYDTTYVEAIRMLGYAEDLGRNYLDALEAYTAVIRADTNFSRLIYFQIGELYHKMNRPDQAVYYLRKFESLQERLLLDFGIRGERELENEREALARLPSMMLAARITLDSTEFINATEISNVGPPINSARNDYFPFYSNDGLQILFTRQNEGGDEDLIRAQRRDLTANWSTRRVGSFNTSKPEGMITLVRDGEQVFFTQCDVEGEANRGCDVYSGVMIDGKVESVTPLPDYVNSDTWDSQAGISCDGRKLFFSSFRPGGVGGSDIYYCDRLPDGSWSRPRNLGVPVNTPGDEEAPFLSNDGQSLFFSSTGHDGLGDQDIFMAWWDEGAKRWLRPVNLGPPVNSPHRELGFHLSADNRSGYFASDRPGGEGGLDIYEFTLSDKLSGEPITYVSGFVLDSMTGEPFVDQEVPINGGPVLRTNYEGRFFICAGADEVLDLSTQAEGYFPYRNSFAIPRWENQYPYRLDLLLRPMTFKAPPPPPPPPPAKDTVRFRKVLVKQYHSVLFNFDETVIIPRQQESLQFFIESIQQGDIQEVTILGYADDIGGDDYNLKLSEERAHAVGAFLRSAGISIDNVTIKGMGVLTGGPKELNRKVEIKVTVLKKE